MHYFFQVWMQAFGTPDMVFYKLYVACKELKKYLHAVSDIKSTKYVADVLMALRCVVYKATLQTCQQCFAVAVCMDQTRLHQKIIAGNS